MRTEHSNRFHASGDSLPMDNIRCGWNKIFTGRMPFPTDRVERCQPTFCPPTLTLHLSWAKINPVWGCLRVRMGTKFGELGSADVLLTFKWTTPLINVNYYAPAPGAGGIKRWCAFDVCLSVCLSCTSGLSQEQRGLGRLKLAQR